MDRAEDEYRNRIRREARHPCRYRFCRGRIVKAPADPQVAPMDDRMGRCDRADKARQHRDRICPESHADSGSFCDQQGCRRVGVYSSLYHSNHQHTIHRRVCLRSRNSRGDYGKLYRISNINQNSEVPYEYL